MDIVHPVRISSLLFSPTQIIIITQKRVHTPSFPTISPLRNTAHSNRCKGIDRKGLMQKQMPKIKTAMNSKSMLALALIFLAVQSLTVIANISGAISSRPHLLSPTSKNQPRKFYRTLQVQVVHRHGDRTPITALKDEEFWAKTLVPPQLLERISSNTKVMTTGERNTHAAGGRGPFGKLTQLGLLQLVDLGNQLREELVTEKDHSDFTAFEDDPLTNEHKLYRYPWHPKRPLHPKNIKVYSTNFPRTIQSVQGLLVGLFPDGTEEPIHIDATETNEFIPDPQPRRSAEQIALEAQLANQPHLKEKEIEMKPIAIRVTEALMDSLGDGALDVAYGVGEEQSQGVLSWAQLSEITKCLQVRDLLPPSISPEDQEIISKYTAWRWFESLSHPRLAYLAMNPMVTRMVDSMQRHEEEPPVIIYSAHDSTLIGLLCGFRLEQPSVWPEYGSYLKVELLEVTATDGDSSVPLEEAERVVRFSLNGSLLRSNWEGAEEPMIEIPLSVLTHKVKTVGASS